MTINKAIEILQQDLDDPGSVDISDLNTAQQLGIEALKREKEWRQRYEPLNPQLLPGETED